MSTTVASDTEATKVASTLGTLSLTAEKSGEKGPSYLPYFDVNEKFPPTPIREFTDLGSRADPKKPNLLGPATSVRQISPYIGSEVRGVQLSQLSPAGLDELALFVASIEIARHFGPIQVHPTSGNIKDFPEFHVVYRDADHNRFREYFGGNRVSKASWHSDVAYEKQRPGTTLFRILDIPERTTVAKRSSSRLSPEFQKRLEVLRAVNSVVEQNEYSRERGGPMRRESEHPVVRVQPVTGEKALYVNQGFTRRIVGLKQEESDWLLKFLFDHLENGSDFQVRASYEPATVVVWDNRVTAEVPIPA
ncbi:hypothetical protein ACEPAI_3263 [Sanghuangporus weigelae]